MPGCELKKNFIRCRAKSPSRFDKRSFRWKKKKDGNAVVVGCPIGHFKNDKCNVGMQAQSLVFKNTPGNRRKLLHRKK
jgi:hypothetical protein